MKVSVKQLVDAANLEIKTMSQAEAKRHLNDDDYLFVDIRDIRELQNLGKIPGASHAPRGMLEFWVDTESPYHKPMFAEDKTFIFYCASAWRSALATQVVQKMGLAKVCHLEGGFSAWQKAELAIEALPERKKS